MSEPRKTPPADFGFRAQPVEQFAAEVGPNIGPQIKSEFRGRFIHEFASLKPFRDWLLKGVFLAKTFCLVIGAPGSGKSFLALDLALTMALAAVDPTAPREWFGRRIKPCGVIYLAAEGGDDFTIRVQAWLLAKGLPADFKLPMFLIPTAVDLRSSEDNARKLSTEINNVAQVMRLQFNCDVGVLFIDTFNRVLAGGDDTSPEHVGRLIRNFDILREATGAAVIAIHHTSKNSKTNDPRGHSSIRADNDGEIFVTKGEQGAPNCWTVTRAKGAPGGDRFEYRLRSLIVGRDENEREEITSCIVAPGGMVASQEAFEQRDAAEAARTGRPNMTLDGRYILPTVALNAMRALDKLVKAEAAKANALDKNGHPLRLLPPDDVRVPHGAVAVKAEDWFEEIVRTRPDYIEPTDTNKAEVAKLRDRARQTRNGAVEKFTEKGLVGVDKGWIWRTGRRVAGVDRPERDEFAPRKSGPTPEQLGITDDEIDKMF